MFRISFRASFVVAIGITLFSAGLAQKRDKTSFAAEKYLISATAGGVNHTEGSVSIVRSNGKSGLLLKGDQIEIGDRVSTGPGSRAEILLNPGSYLRLGSNSLFAFDTTSLDDLQIRLDSGSALFEVYAANEFTVTIFTHKGQARLVDTGVYRVDLAADGTGTIAVTKGKAEVGIVNRTIVKKGRTATIGAGTGAIAKFDRDKRDEFAEWSRTRAKDLAKMTSSLKNRDVRDSLISSFNSGVWGMRRSFGLWVYNRFSRLYCFLPFGDDWDSPYGYGFGSGIWWYDLPRTIRYPPPGPTPVISPSTGKQPPGTKAGDGPLPVDRIGPRRSPPIRDVETPDFPREKGGSRNPPIFTPPTSLPMPAPKTSDLPQSRKPIDN